jgi:hypothetical protein
VGDDYEREPHTLRLVFRPRAPSRGFRAGRG